MWVLCAGHTALSHFNSCLWDCAEVLLKNSIRLFRSVLLMHFDGGNAKFGLPASRRLDTHDPFPYEIRISQVVIKERNCCSRFLEADYPAFNGPPSATRILSAYNVKESG